MDIESEVSVVLKNFEDLLVGDFNDYVKEERIAVVTKFFNSLSEIIVHEYEKVKLITFKEKDGTTTYPTILSNEEVMFMEELSKIYKVDYKIVDLSKDN